MTDNQENKTSRYTCTEYREEMVILALRQKLAKTTLTDKEKDELEKEIFRLEKKLGF